MFAAIFAIIFPFFLASMAIGRALAGEVLLDCGPFPSRKLFGAMSVLMFVVSVGTAISATETFANLIAAFFCGLALYLLIASTGRLQICENGVFQYWSLLRWNKIKSYRWEGTTDATLMLQTTNSFAFLGRGALPVAIEQKDAVDALMQQHVA